MSGKSAFTEDQINDFQETFNLFDTKGDGKIPVSYPLSLNSNYTCTSLRRSHE